MGGGDWEVGLGGVFCKWYWEVGSVSEFRISLDIFLNNFKSNLDRFGVFFLYIFCSKSTQDGPSWVHGGGEGGRFHRFRGRPEGQVGVKHRPKTFRKSISNVSCFCLSLFDRVLDRCWNPEPIQISWLASKAWDDVGGRGRYGTTEKLFSVNPKNVRNGRNNRIWMSVHRHHPRGPPTHPLVVTSFPGESGH